MKVIRAQDPAMGHGGLVDPSGRPLSSKSPVRLATPHLQPLRMLSGTNSSYDAAAYGRRLGNWIASVMGPNAIVYNSLGTIRGRVRDLVRNNPWMKGAVETYSANIVGTGISPRWKLDDVELKKKIQMLWNQWIQYADADGMLDFYGLQTLVEKTRYQSGECLIRLRTRRMADGLPVPFQLQVLEPDYISQVSDGILANGNVVRMGIEFNALGQKLAYYLYRNHPGDTLVAFQDPLSVVRVPAEQIIHIYKVDRPGQLRGIPELASIVARMFILDQYEDAELDRKKTAALFAAFITLNQADQPIHIGFDADNQVDDQDHTIASLEPGIMQYLLPGEDIKFASPADVGPNYEMWIRMQLRGVATGCGITYEQLTGDLSGVNYSSIRAGLVEFRRKASQTQNNVLVFQMCRKVAQWFLNYAVASGALDIPDYMDDPFKYQNIMWQPDGWDWVDPLKDVNAAKQAIMAGITTRDAVVSKTSARDIEEVDQEASDDQKRADKLGLKFDTDMRTVDGATATGAKVNGANKNVVTEAPAPATAPAAPGKTAIAKQKQK